MDHGFAAPFDLDALRSKVEGRFDAVHKGKIFKDLIKLLSSFSSRQFDVI